MLVIEVSMLEIEIFVLLMVTKTVTVDWHQITKVFSIVKSQPLYIVHWMLKENKIN